jgi:hypothetical protein
MRHIIGWAVAGALASFAAPAQEPGEQRSAVAAGQRAVLDPVTGRPTQPAAGERGRSAFGRQRRDYSRMVFELRPDGEQIVHTMGQTQVASFARLRADGSAELKCRYGDVHGPDEHPHPHPHAPAQAAAGARTSAAPE